MVLGQKQNGGEVVISYAGQKLNPAERNYSVTEREALAVVDGVRHFQTYLYGCQFTVLTDHNAVRWLMNIKDPALADIITYLETEELPSNGVAAKAIMHSIDDYYLDPNGLLCHLWVPKGHHIQTPKSRLFPLCYDMRF